MIFTRDDRAGEGVLSSRLGLFHQGDRGRRRQSTSTAMWSSHLSGGGRADYVIVDEAQFLAPRPIDQLARIVDDLGLDVFAFGITTDFRSKLFPGSQRLVELATAWRCSRSRRCAGAAPGRRTTPARSTARWSSRAPRSSSATSTGRRARWVTRCCAAVTTGAG